MIYYLVYKLTNMVNGKIYVGCHVTKDVNDGYMGSGRRLGYAKKKYGEAAFKKEILKVCETADEMLAEEKRIVDEEFLKRSDVYNLTCGGRGSWFWINDAGKSRTGREKGNASSVTQKKRSTKHVQRLADPVYRSAWIAKLSKSFRGSCWTGRKHSDESKKKIGIKNSISQQGSRNSSFNTKWMNKDGQVIKAKTEQVKSMLSEGWILGRINRSLEPSKWPAR